MALPVGLVSFIGRCVDAANGFVFRGGHEGAIEFASAQFADLDIAMTYGEPISVAFTIDAITKLTQADTGLGSLLADDFRFI